MLSWLIESKSFKKCFWCSLDADSGILTFLVTSLHSVPVTGLHVLIGTILHTFSVKGTWDHVNVSGIRTLVDLDVLAEGSWLEGALLLHLLPGNLLHHPPLHRLALLGLFIAHFFDDILQGLQKERILELTFLTTSVQTFSSTCLFAFLITQRHFFTSSGAHTLLEINRGDIKLIAPLLLYFQIDLPLLG